MLQIRENFHTEGAANQQINVHVELVTYKVNICIISFPSEFSISPPTLKPQMNRKITLSTALKYK